MARAPFLDPTCRLSFLVVFYFLSDGFLLALAAFWWKAQYLIRNISLFFLYVDLKDLHWDKPSIFLVSLLELPVSLEFKLRSFMTNEASKILDTVVLFDLASFTLCVLQWSVESVVSVLEVKQHLSHLLIRQFIAGFHSAQGLVPTIQGHQSSPVSIDNVSGQRLALMVISEYVKESFFKAGLRYPGYNKIEENENRCFTHARNRARC